MSWLGFWLHGARLLHDRRGLLHGRGLLAVAELFEELQHQREDVLALLWAHAIASKSRGLGVQRGVDAGATLLEARVEDHAGEFAGSGVAFELLHGTRLVESHAGVAPSRREHCGERFDCGLRIPGAMRLGRIGGTAIRVRQRAVLAVRRPLWIGGQAVGSADCVRPSLVASRAGT